MDVSLLSAHFPAAHTWNDPRDDGGSIVPRTGKSKRKLSGILVIESSKSFVGFAAIGFASASVLRRDTAPTVLFTNSHPLPAPHIFLVPQRYSKHTARSQFDGL